MLGVAAEICLGHLAESKREGERVGIAILHCHVPPTSYLPGGRRRALGPPPPPPSCCSSLSATSCAAQHTAMAALA